MIAGMADGVNAAHTNPRVDQSRLKASKARPIFRATAQEGSESDRRLLKYRC